MSHSHWKERRNAGSRKREGSRRTFRAASMRGPFNENRSQRKYRALPAR